MDLVLVHGSYHGAWCWDRLRPELEGLGHRVITMDLPVSAPALGASAYADVVIEAIDGSIDPVVIGHSMAGLVIPLVAARRKVRRLVFLTAFLPLPGSSANDQRASEPIDGRFTPTTSEWTAMGDDVWSVGPNTATEIFFHDADPATAAWAVQQLRPQSYRVMNEITPLETWPEVESRAIICADDHALNVDWARSAYSERLGVVPVELPGGHSPFMTKPAELARAIDAAIG
jgi:pimeloyl-ACP methyl ester carboxylesterase